MELGRLVMAQNKKALLDNWWKVRAGWPLGWPGWVGRGFCVGMQKDSCCSVAAAAPPGPAGNWCGGVLADRRQHLISPAAPIFSPCSP